MTPENDWASMLAHLQAYDWSAFLQAFLPNLAATFFGAVCAIPTGLFVSRRFEAYRIRRELRELKTTLLRQIDRVSLATSKADDPAALRIASSDRQLLSVFLSNPRMLAAAPVSLTSAVNRLEGNLGAWIQLHRMVDEATASGDVQSWTEAKGLVRRRSSGMQTELDEATELLRDELRRWRP